MLNQATAVLCSEDCLQIEEKESSEELSIVVVAPKNRNLNHATS